MRSDKKIDWEHGELPKGMDPQCVPLCRALNRLDGITTTESCCGHGKSPFHIWFRARNIPSLFVVGRVLSHNYGTPFYKGHRVWTGTISINDMLHDQAGVRFLLSTRDDIRGRLAYRYAERLVQDIHWYLDKSITGIKSHMDYFNVRE